MAESNQMARFEPKWPNRGQISPDLSLTTNRVNLLPIWAKMTQIETKLA